MKTKIILVTNLVIFTTSLQAQDLNISKHQNADEKEKKLISEIHQINDAESYLLFLKNHAATYEDFDSLYTQLENKPCPKYFTYTLVHGDSSESQIVSKTFLYLVSRNFRTFNIDESKYKSHADLPSFNSFKMNFEDAYQKIKPVIKNKVKISSDSLAVDKLIIDTHCNGYILVKNNIRSWSKELYRMNRSQLRNLNLKVIENVFIDFALNRPIELYTIKEIGSYENSIWNQIIRQDETFLEQDFGGTTIAKNISKYISAQVFNDIGFILINNKLVFIDIDR